MFGASYSYQKQPKILADGDYDVVLGTPYETQVSTFPVLRFPITVDGETGPCVPGYFDLFDCLDASDPEKVAMFNKQASKIKACFKLYGSFNAQNYVLWAGHKGKVRVEKSKTGFTNVSHFYKADMTAAEEANL